MLSICEEFSKEYLMKFNGNKSMCIKYGEKYEQCEKAHLNKETIINNDLSDIDDCKMNFSSFISSFNNLHCNYTNVQPCILSKLFQVVL